jgi:hypothetical protein
MKYHCKERYNGAIGTRNNNLRAVSTLTIIMYKFLCFMCLFLILSCSSEKTAEVVTQKPSEPRVRVSCSMEIVPINATSNSIVYLVTHGFNLSETKIEWLVNGKPASSSMSTQFPANKTKKNDKVQARAVVQDKEILSNIIEIKNSPPVISKVKILPEVFKPGDTLSVEASGSDGDGDDVTISYEWTKNGEPAGKNKQIDVPLRRGDKVDIKITPFDGEAYGQTVILHRGILNLPPMIIENKNYNFNGELYTYQVNANDPDGDQLTYSLKTAPAGMTIEPSTGSIKWSVPTEFEGKTSFIVSVNDGHGGEATQTFNLEIKPGTRQITPG